MRCKVCQKVVRYPGNSSKVDQTCGKCQKIKSHSAEESAQNIIVTLLLSKLAEVCVQPHVHEHVSSSNPACPFNLGRVCPDGTVLTQYTRLAVCVSDGSVDEECGIAAASVCMFPDEDVWEEPAAAIKMYARGSACSELLGMAFSLDTLTQNVSRFDTAVVYTDNAKCIDYIGGCTRSDIEPISNDGWKLYPLILYVRRMVLQLQNSDKRILVKKLPKEQNVAHHIAKACMREEKARKWPETTYIARIDAVPGLRERIQLVSRFSKMVSLGQRIPRSADELDEPIAELTYEQEALMQSDSIGVCAVRISSSSGDSVPITQRTYVQESLMDPGSMLRSPGDTAEAVAVRTYAAQSSIDSVPVWV